MRIVGGIWRGRRLEAPEGRAVTRPTTDRVREAMASMVLSARGLDMTGARVLDAFAGSGAIGLELLSRGASYAAFADADKSSVARVRRNATQLGADKATWSVTCANVLSGAGRRRLPHGPFDILALDPPYATPAQDVTELVESLRDEGLLAEDALVLYERDSGAPELSVSHSDALKTKRYGGTAVDLIRLEARHDRL